LTRIHWASRNASMRRLHIVQGGIENGDKKWLERAARNHWDAPTWIVPKSANVGDDVVIYVGHHGFFATARINSGPSRRSDWQNRYGARLGSIALVKPAISLGVILRYVPKLNWAKYPRSVTTPSPSIAAQIRELIGTRRRTRMPDLDDDALNSANMDELRTIALMKARRSVPPRERSAIYRARTSAIHRYVLCRANGHCEGCGDVAPFKKADGSPYLEPHHTTRLADDGPDHPAKVIALCPTCHRRAHYAGDATAFNHSLVKLLPALERRRLER
jgi:hypothetical protein